MSKPYGTLDSLFLLLKVDIIRILIGQVCNSKSDKNNDNMSL